MLWCTHRGPRWQGCVWPLNLDILTLSVQKKPAETICCVCVRAREKMRGDNRETALKLARLCADLCSLFKKKKKKVKSICATVERIQKFGLNMFWLYYSLSRRQQIYIPCKFDFMHATATLDFDHLWICPLEVQIWSTYKVGPFWKYGRRSCS